jgi:hypothetical protein
LKGGVKTAKKGVPGLSFSLSRATGVSSAKSKVAKSTGIPTTKSGRQKKIGGLFGKDDNEREGLYLKYTKERFSRFKNESYNSYIKKYKQPIIIRAIFPNAKILSQKFPCVGKLPLLYPVFWLYRISKFIISLLKKDKSLNKYINREKYIEKNAVIEKRMDLIRELGMV